MNKILTLILTIGLVLGLTGCFNGGDGNRPPNAPTVSLPSEASVNEKVVITVRTVDPDGNQVAYKVRYGDDVDSEWSGYFSSGQSIEFTHKYEEPGDYRVKAIASDREAIGQWSEDKWIKIKTSQPPPQRKMSILWMGDESWVELVKGISFSATKTLYRDTVETWDTGFGGTHIVSFDERCRPDWYPPSEVKLISYLKGYSLAEIRAYARRWKDHPNNGGYWLFEGHEPDITGTLDGSFEKHRQLRIAQYKAIREEDPNSWNHPVVIWYDNTGASDNGWPGWQNAFPKPEEGVDCDIYAADIYPNKCDGTIDYPALERAANNLVVIGLERSEKQQYIPCLGAFVHPNCQAASLIEQWEWWVGWHENQTGEKLKSVAFYFSGVGSVCDGIYENEKLGREAREINRRLGLL